MDRINIEVNSARASLKDKNHVVNEFDGEWGWKLERRELARARVGVKERVEGRWTWGKRTLSPSLYGLWTGDEARRRRFQRLKVF
ncbi:hypothetical protein GOBAR_DD27433 [Gossypium barbadense]|nr:hypothetical protein GOBAR_DD27433 [Gossypium barbadense]